MNIATNDENKNPNFLKLQINISHQIQNKILGLIEKENPDQIKNLVDLIGKLIVEFSYQVGITNMGDQQTKQDIIYFIFKYFKSLTVNDIQLGFNYAIIGKIEIPANKHHYGKLTPSFISYILGEFEKLKRILIIHKKYPFPIDVPKEDNAKKQITIGKASMIRFHYQSYLEKGSVLMGNSKDYYEYLVNSGYINMTPEHKQEYIARANLMDNKINKSNEINKTELNSDMGKIFDQIIGISNNTEEKKNEYLWKKLVIIDLFEKWKQEKRKPEEIKL